MVVDQCRCLGRSDDNVTSLPTFSVQTKQWLWIQGSAAGPGGRRSFLISSAFKSLTLCLLALPTSSIRRGNDEGQLHLHQDILALPPLSQLLIIILV